MGKKILLADDSITIQKVIELTFSDEDFEVVTVGNGRLAMDRIAEVRPDVVLCDIIMPEKDGYEVCDYIKKSPSLSHIPVLLLTGAFEPFDQDRANRVGCDGFLAKPFEPQTLIAKVKDLLAKAAPKSTTASFRAVPAPPPPPPPAPPPAAAPAAPEPWSSAPAPPPWAAPAPLPPAAPEPAAAPEPEDDRPTMVSKPGAYGALLEDRPYGAAGVVPPPDLPPVSAEESASLGGASKEPDGSSTVMFEAGKVPWSQQTIEVPLELRAKAGVSAQAEPQPLFEDVFEEPPAPPPPPAAAPAPAAPAGEEEEEPEEVFAEPDEEEEAPAPPWSAPSATAAPAAAPSFADVTPAAAPEPAAPASEAAQVSVPPEMVEKIAQRVVAQISEKVVREVAWEVIPDLAEALIKKEIDRLKDELQRT
jgi:CheY-like chemotaxis protein